MLPIITDVLKSSGRAAAAAAVAVVETFNVTEPTVVGAGTLSPLLLCSELVLYVFSHIGYYIITFILKSSGTAVASAICEVVDTHNVNKPTVIAAVTPSPSLVYSQLVVIYVFPDMLLYYYRYSEV